MGPPTHPTPRAVAVGEEGVVSHLAELHAPLPPGRKSPRSDHLVVVHVRKPVVGVRQANYVQQTSEIYVSTDTP